MFYKRREGWRKAEVAKRGEKVTDEAKREEVKEAKREEAKREEAKREEAKREEAKREEAKREEAKREEAPRYMARLKHGIGRLYKLVRFGEFNSSFSRCYG
jgi:site-specific DNA-adenine methylase